MNDPSVPSFSSELVALRRRVAELETANAGSQAELARLNETLRQETMARQAAEATFRHLVAGTSAATGPAFFEALVRELAGWLGMRWAIVGELQPGPPETIQSLAFWNDGQLGPPQTYALTGTPCHEVNQKGFCFFPANIQDLFPTDTMVALGAQSYAGVPLKGQTGRPVGILCAFHDRPVDPPANLEQVMTVFSRRAGVEIVRRRIEAALLESETRYRFLADNMADVVWILDAATARFTYVSPSVERLRGFTVEEVIAQPLEEVVAPASRSMAREVLPAWIAAYLAGDPAAKTQTHEVEQMCRDGSTVWTEIVSTLLGDRPDNLQILGVTRNITARRQAEAERERLIAELQQALAQVKRLSGLLPICASCKKIRDDRGYWQQVEVYLRSRAEVEFSHSICPDCKTRLYPPEKYPYLYQEEE